MKTLGVDPGLDGAVSVIVDGRVESIHSMPTCELPLVKGTRREVDAVGLDALIPRDADLVVIERVWGDKGFGGSRSFTFGGTYYTAIAVVRLARLPLLRITAQEWKKLVLPDDDHSKEASIAFIEKAYPGTNLVPPRKRTKSHDWAEATILAHIGALRLKEEPCLPSLVYAASTRTTADTPAVRVRSKRAKGGTP